ncbi:MAG: hypothetical protein EOP85_18775 [Verrucomicrobiaceae bacterium]|nr:MAG: hypothetical protein EOP85_18775 [Verrucomicrobiaceae bacterium]
MSRNRFRRPPSRVKPLLLSLKKATSVLPVLLSGPRQLVTTGLTVKSACLMILLSIPMMLVTAMITVPGFVFSDQQNETYFFIASNLTQDLGGGVILCLAAGFSILALMVPALGRKKLAGR